MRAFSVLVINNKWIMKTKEELEQMTKEELVSMAEQLQKEKELWLDSFHKAEGKLKAVKGMVSSLVVFID